MMKSLLLFLSFAVTVLFISSCTKDKTPCTTCPTVGTDCEDIQNVKNFFAFKEGSWWVYEEETSGVRDSVYVTEYQNDPSNYNFDVRVYSSYQDYYYHYWPEFSSGAQSCNESGLLCERCLSVKRSKYKPGDFVAEGKCFFFIPKVGQFDYVYNTELPNNRVTISSISDSFTYSNYTYQRTVEVNEDNTYMEGIQPTNHYFSENVGLIRKELLDSNQVWNLVNYHIQE
ncbi:MAG: hypothetical protein HWE22_08160 [Flavobacteriales bacterium]|nr:hypothetical protein [Flavobacteriales bacterium]